MLTRPLPCLMKKNSLSALSALTAVALYVDMTRRSFSVSVNGGPFIETGVNASPQCPDSPPSVWGLRALFSAWWEAGGTSPNSGARGHTHPFRLRTAARIRAARVRAGGAPGARALLRAAELEGRLHRDAEL